MSTPIKVRVKDFGALPRGIHPHQARYKGKIIHAQKRPIIVGWVWEQIDPKNESACGIWIWPENLITPIKQRKKS